MSDNPFITSQDALPGTSELFDSILNSRVEVGAGNDNPATPPKSSGEFDPSIHATNDDGTPRLTKTGKLRLRPGAKSRLNAGLNLPGEKPPPTEYDVAGHAAAMIFVTTGTILLGADFQPENEGEHEQVANAFACWCEANNINDVPPGIALAIALSGYIGKRLYKPTVSERLGFAVSWTATKFGSMGARLGAWFNTRPDRLRKNNASAHVGESGKGARNTGVNFRSLWPAMGRG